MNTNCEYCEALNLLTLLDAVPEDLSDDLKKKAVRYYCNNPNTDNDYCPYSGDKGLCKLYYEQDCKMKESG